MSKELHVQLNSHVFPETSWIKKNKHLLQQIVASSAGSLVANLILNPLNVIKINIQVQDGGSSAMKSGSSVLMTTVRDIYAQNGHKLSAFWSGTSTSLLMSVPSTVFYMVTYEKLKSIFSTYDIPTQITPGISGFLARGCAVTLISPLELIRTIQSSGNHATILPIARSIIRNEGWTGLYRGWIPTVLRDCPYSAMYWFNFELFRSTYTTFLQTHTSLTLPTYMITFASGATSSLLAALVTHPFDVIKTRRQVSQSLPHPTTPIAQTPTIWNTLRYEGVGSLYKGLSMRLFTVIPGSAILVTVYETVKAMEFFTDCE